MASAAERLAEYRRKNHPSFDVLANIPMIKGEPGYTPVKGKDYFTEKEIDAFIAHLRSMVKDGAPGTQGNKGEPGESVVGPRGPEGKAGKTPVYGIDYFTKKDVEKLIKLATVEVLSRLPKTKEKIVIPTAKEVAAQIKYEHIPGAPDLKDLPQLIAFLKAGGFRGGGGSSASTGGGFTLLTATETPDGVRTVFTFPTATAQPSFIVSDNAMMKAVTKAGTTNWTWDAGNLQATMTIPPADDIVGVV